MAKKPSKEVLLKRNKARKEARGRKKLEQKWKSGCTGTASNGKRSILKYTKVDDDTTFRPTCPSCLEPLDYTNSVKGKMIVGMIGRPGYTELRIKPKDHTILPVDYYRDPAPKLATVRVCTKPECVAKLVEILEDEFDRYQPSYADHSTIGFATGGDPNAQVDLDSYNYFHRKQGRRKGE